MVKAACYCGKDRSTMYVASQSSLAHRFSQRLARPIACDTFFRRCAHRFYSCGKVCNKQLACGHQCQQQCHGTLASSHAPSCINTTSEVTLSSRFRGRMSELSRVAEANVHLRQRDIGPAMCYELLVHASLQPASRMWAPCMHARMPLGRMSWVSYARAASVSMRQGEYVKCECQTNG